MHEDNAVYKYTENRRYPPIGENGYTKEILGVVLKNVLCEIRQSATRPYLAGRHLFAAIQTRAACAGPLVG